MNPILELSHYIDTKRDDLPSFLKVDSSVLDFKDGAADFLSRRGRSVLGDVHPSAVIDGDVVIEAGARVGPNVVIEGPAFVGAGAVLRNGAYVRDTSFISSGATVGFAVEITRSVLLPGAECLHHAVVPDSLLGFDTSLAGGTMLCNIPLAGDRTKMKNILIRTSVKSYDTGFTKFGSVIGDRTRSGAHVVVNPGTLIGPDSLIYLSAPAPGGYLPVGTQQLA